MTIFCIITKRNNVYNFGKLLLDLITGKWAIIKSYENDNINNIDWVSPLLARGSLRNIVDPWLRGKFDTNSVWKAIETVIACVPLISIQSPKREPCGDWIGMLGDRKGLWTRLECNYEIQRCIWNEPFGPWDGYSYPSKVVRNYVLCSQWLVFYYNSIQTIREKWPISINFWNIWARNTVWEIYRKIPLFVVLELGELKYPIFLFHRGTWRWHLEFKKKLGTRAHEAWVLLSHVSPLPTLKPYVTQSLNHLLPRAKHTHKPNLSISLSPSQSKAISTQILSFCLSISQSASFSVSVSLSVSLSHCCSRSRSPSHKVCLAQLACSACGYFCL